jgi:hypothetical protein
MINRNRAEVQQFILCLIEAWLIEVAAAARMGIPGMD